jgi:hypothetical protein
MVPADKLVMACILVSSNLNIDSPSHLPKITLAPDVGDLPTKIIPKRDRDDSLNDSASRSQASLSFEP